MQQHRGFERRALTCSTAVLFLMWACGERVGDTPLGFLERPSAFEGYHHVETTDAALTLLIENRTYKLGRGGATRLPPPAQDGGRFPRLAESSSSTGRVNQSWSSMAGGWWQGRRSSQPRAPELSSGSPVLRACAARPTRSLRSYFGGAYA